jgi:tetratricopeptide (TPR) repeat protein
MKPGKRKQKQRVKRGKSWLPEDVLAGKVVLGALELVELIQRVNPTDRELPRAEVARRYRLKNQLQSLLVRRFASEVEVSADREGVTLLAHRGSGRSACHAVLAELDEDARSWVQRRLDEAVAPEPATTPAAPPARASARSSGLMNGNAAGHLAESESLLDGDVSAKELLARGHEAMAAYDYELARHAYERALASSGGDAAAAEALLGLLVEHLAAYAEAAALWPRVLARSSGRRPDPHAGRAGRGAGGRGGARARALARLDAGGRSRGRGRGLPGPRAPDPRARR